MRITDEMLYAAAEAAERYLDTLPGQTDCTHAFSPAFEEKLQFLLPRRRKKKLWKLIILLAAAVALLGTAVYANQPEDYQDRAAARDGILTYSARPQVQAGDLCLACGEADIALFGMERMASGEKLDSGKRSGDSRCTDLYRREGSGSLLRGGGDHRGHSGCVHGGGVQ